MKNKLTLLITGPLAPPAGGVSIHIQRLAHLLREDFQLDFIDESDNIKPDFLNIRKAIPWRYIRKVRHCDVFFIQSGSRKLKKLHLFTGWLLRKKTLITIHGFGVVKSKAGLYIDSLFYRLADKIILVNPDIRKQLSLPESKCVVKHAFLPPVMESEPALPAAVTEFIQKAKAKKHTIFCANASRLNLHDGFDLYGLDMCIQLLKDIKQAGRRVSFVFVLSSDTTGKDMLANYKEQIRISGLEEDFLLLQTNLSFIRLIAASDIVIRPTNIDGDALTVREGLFLGKKVIASDVVTRPEGTVLFATRNQQNLMDTVMRELTGLESGSEVSITAQQETNDYRSFYKDLVNQVAHRS